MGKTKPKKLQETVEDILTYMTLAESQDLTCADVMDNDGPKLGVKGLIKEHQVDLFEFDGADPIFTGSGDRQDFFTDVSPRDVDRRLNVAFVNLPKEEDAGERVRYTLTRMRPLPIKSLRGQRIISDFPVEVLTAFIHEDGSYESARLRAFYAGKDRDGIGIWAGWHWSGHTVKRDSLDGDVAVITGHAYNDIEMTNTLNMAVSAEFTRFYEWAVFMGFDGSPTIRFVTDPDGAKDTFRLRDIKPGASRRSALRNWVTQHWRQNRVSADMSLVRRHLRGETKFQWGALRCEIVPSQHDINLYRRIMGKSA